ncbi:MAG: pyridoxamine 5'-phosphate oxidase family protein [Marinibacterium sp.]
MPVAFANLAFTPSVRAAQDRLGSARSYARLLSADVGGGDRLGPDETGFIAARDGMFQATVSADGWPYVQFRGGPAGFMAVLDDRTIAYADLRGNLQYLSLGNLADNDRVSLILVDYPNQRRLKIWGHARLVEADNDPGLVERLMPPGQHMTPERAVIIRVAAFDWNCPRNIPRRYTEAEAHFEFAELSRENTALKAELDALRRATAQGTPPKAGD